jgi:2-C-methyl-D-erythritol 4-phosphate cytidylyltransferase
MFRLGLLTDALEAALHKGERVTDDASAVELAGYRPQMVEGQAGNLKITRPADLALAAFYLSHPLS